MDNVWIQINGRGNAWPLDLGGGNDPLDQRHGALRGNPKEYANTSVSVVRRGSSEDDLQWEVLVDVGQGVIPALVQRANRLPDAVILTHPHYDHISGLDWLISNHKRHAQKKRGADPLPLYASDPCWRAFRERFGYLEGSVVFKELLPGQPTIIEAVPSLTVTAFPVFHGPFAPGAMILLVEYQSDEGSVEKAVLAWDVLCPLLRNQDYERLSGAKLFIADANTRFPSPGSSHWSIVSACPPAWKRESPLERWRSEQGADLTYLQSPHRPFSKYPRPYLVRPYFQQFEQDWRGREGSLPYSIVEFAQLVDTRAIYLVHYSGYEDMEDYNESILNDAALKAWAIQQALNSLPNVTWDVPVPGGQISFA